MADLNTRVSLKWWTLLSVTNERLYYILCKKKKSFILERLSPWWTSLIQDDINTDIMGSSGTVMKTISITSPKALPSCYALFYTDKRGTAHVCHIMITSKEASLSLFISSCVHVFKSPCNREKECECAHISVFFFCFFFSKHLAKLYSIKGVYDRHPVNKVLWAPESRSIRDWVSRLLLGNLIPLSVRLPRLTHCLCTHANTMLISFLDKRCWKCPTVQDLPIQMVHLSWGG